MRHAPAPYGRPGQVTAAPITWETCGHLPEALQNAGRARMVSTTASGAAVQRCALRADLNGLRVSSSSTAVTTLEHDATLASGATARF